MPLRRCGCFICKFKCEPVSIRKVNSHLQKYGEYTEERSPQSSPRRHEYHDDGLYLSIKPVVNSENGQTRETDTDDDDDDCAIELDYYSESENHTNVVTFPCADVDEK